MLISIMIKGDTQANLARRTGLAQSTVSNIVGELQTAGVLPNDKAEQARAVRRGTVRLPPTRNVAVGVHLGFVRATVVARRVDRPISETHSEHVASGANRGMSEVIPVLKQAIREAVGRTSLGLEDVVSLGVAVPRMVDPRTGRFASPILPPWSEGDDPSRDLGAWLGVPGALDNDANLGALAEQTYATDGHAEIVVYIKGSTGIGAGLVISNTPIRGRGMAGEIGHLVFDPNGAVCRCGGRGCLETVIGANALVRQARDALSGSAVDVPHSLASLIEKAQAGDVVCERIMRDAGRVLGQALAQLCNLLNPDLIVVGGTLGAAQGMVLDPCQESLERFALRGAVGPHSGFTLKSSSMNQLSEAQGALLLGLTSLRRSDDTQEQGRD
ncbi:ROK family protein [Streptomyces apocyni]|uniref:ROK family protein n=1 Tax=Streptomyces apocyni TaxID=2654677 RepID=UPI0018D17EA8|nr:ROK family protein [Streptomyces apocyni]